MLAKNISNCVNVKQIDTGIYAFIKSTNPIKTPYAHPNNKTPFEAPAFLLPWFLTSILNKIFPMKNEV